MEDVYELFCRGTELLGAGHNHQAAIPLAQARDLAPDKMSIREALGRALFGAQRYEQAAVEFEAVAAHSPTNDFALFCLGRSLQMLGRHAEARKPLALAASLQPGRRDYRVYRDRARARAASSGVSRQPPARLVEKANT
jgi:Flp pilus assembly protein TadD